MEQQVKREIEIQSNLKYCSFCLLVRMHSSIDSRHPNILRLYGFFHDEQRIYLLLEYAPGGELYRRMQSEKTLRETEAAGVSTVAFVIVTRCTAFVLLQYVYQLCNALNYLHTKRVIHR